jgi:hypothetical protein
MNDVYQAARFVLPPAQFAKVKAEQRDATGSIAAKTKLTVERTEALQDIAW